MSEKVEKNVCINCGKLLLYAIETRKELLWGLCKECFKKGHIPNPPYNRYLETEVNSNEVG